MHASRSCKESCLCFEWIKYCIINQLVSHCTLSNWGSQYQAMKNNSAACIFGMCLNGVKHCGPLATYGVKEFDRLDSDNGLAPTCRYCLNQRWILVKPTLSSKLQWNLNWIFFSIHRRTMYVIISKLCRSLLTTQVLTHKSYVFLALAHRYIFHRLGRKESYRLMNRGPDSDVTSPLMADGCALSAFPRFTSAE